MAKLLNLIRSFDLFQLPIQLLASRSEKYQSLARKDKNHKTTFIYKYGTVIGFILSLGLMFLMISYLTYTLNRMYSLKDDKYSSLSVVNHFNEGESSFILKDFKFAPSINFWFLAKTKQEIDEMLADEDLDIFVRPVQDPYNELVIDYEKLQKYIIPRLKVRRRSSAMLSNFHRFDFMKCDQTYYAQTGHEPGEGSPPNRYCPDLGAFEDELKIENGYSSN